MAFCNKIGNLLRRGATQSTQAPVSSMLNYLRHMSSSKLFIGGIDLVLSSFFMLVSIIIMALIKCDECGYWCSSNDDSCPNCGYPINPPKPPNNNGKQNLYIILAIVVIVAITTIFALLYTDLAKREQQAKVQTEMLAKELREKKRADSISALRTREEAIRKAVRANLNNN